MLRTLIKNSLSRFVWKHHLSTILQFPNISLKTDKETEYVSKYTSVNKN